LKRARRDSEEKELLTSQSDVLKRVASFRYNERLGNIMERDVYTCLPDTSIDSVAVEMARRRISSAVVVEPAGRPVGIVTERDMVQKVIASGATCRKDQPISAIMTPDPFYLSPDDTLFDALALLSRHSIKHLPVVKKKRVVGILTLRQLMKLQHSEPLVIIGLLEEASDIEGYRQVRQDLIEMVYKKLYANVDPVDVVAMLSLVNADIHKRLLQRAINETGRQPPVEFCLFLSGSHGRRENLLFPDQDYGLVIDDYKDRDFNEFDSYFIRLSSIFSEYLDAAGFPYCTGYVMGVNPTWRKRLSEWALHLRYLFGRQNEHTVRYMTIIFDAAPLYGNHELFYTFQDMAFAEITRHHDMLRAMHEEEGSHKVPLGFFNTFITEKSGPHRGELDMKRSGLIFMIEAARILAIKNGIRETSTMDRLRALVHRGIINPDDSEYFESAYRVILHHTLMAQADNFLKKGSSDYYLNPRELSARSQEILKHSFKAISRLQELVGSEFGELIL